MNYEPIIASGIRRFRPAREFLKLFPNAEHTICEAKRDTPDGWQMGHEWIARAPLHNRYLVWLVVGIEIDSDGDVSELAKPAAYVVVLNGVDMSNDDGPAWDVDIAEFEDGDWERLIESNGDFGTVGIDLETEAPVTHFVEFWDRTRPRDEPHDGMAFKAPLRFIL